MPTTSERRYKHLTLNFLKGTLKGQLRSLHRDKDNLDKLADFKSALANKDVRIHSHQITPAILTLATEFGIQLK